MYWKNYLRTVLYRGLSQINAPKLAELSLSFVDKQEIQRLNKKYRNVDKITDVLSFPLSNPSDWQKDSRLPTSLGDIIVCTQVAQEQAQEYGHSLERELSFLVIHGLLHLAGYDHITPQDEQIMRQLQRDILGELT